MSNLEVLEVHWYNEMGSIRPIGIVTAEDRITGEVKRYIGIGEGLNEAADTEKILSRGAKFSLAMFE